MQNRFGLKEVIVSSLLGLMIVALGGVLFQIDRQYQTMQRIEAELGNHTRMQANIQRELDEAQQRLDVLVHQPIEPPQLTRELLDLRMTLAQILDTINGPIQELTEEISQLRERIESVEERAVPVSRFSLETFSPDA